MRLDLEPIKPGQYVLAVSGGVDSIVLLHLLTQRPEIRIVVAHYDHGIRPDSIEDRQFVQSLAKKYGLDFYYEEGKLGQEASEQLAREKRYQFLNKVKNNTRSDAIVTAHHQDDLIETAVINILRGTGRRGLSSLKSEEIIRLLLGHGKSQIKQYALAHKLEWREDPTNRDKKYLRNWVRLEVIPNLPQDKIATISRFIKRGEQKNQVLDQEIETISQFLQTNKKTLDRKKFIALAHPVSCEVLTAWLRQNGIRQFNKKLIERIVIDAKTLKAGKKTNVSKSWDLEIGQENLELVPV